MRKSRRGFSLFERILILFTLGIVAISSVYIWRNANNNKPLANKKLLVALKDSGSTNFTGWKLEIYTDGSAKLNCDTGPQLNKSCTSASFRSNTFFANRLSRDLAKIHLGTQYNCIRAVSFGSSESLIYGGKSITGIDCYFSTNSTSSLSKDILPFLQNVNLD